MLKIVVRGQAYFACERCGLIYDIADDASRCEAWCSTHGSCNVEIASKSVGRISRVGLRLRGPGPFNAHA